MDKIAMIKEVRKQTEFGLKESKAIVDGWVNSNGGRKELKELVEGAVKNRVPRSEEMRQTIRRRVKSIQNLVECLASDCEGDFSYEEMPIIRGALEQIADEALTIKNRTTYHLEDILSAER